MAAPNIVAVTTIYGKTTYLTPADTNAAVLLANAASSGKVLKINQIVAANVDGSTAVGLFCSYQHRSERGRHFVPNRFDCFGACRCFADCYRQDNRYLSRRR